MDGRSPYWQVALGYSFVGIGVGFAGTPASHSLTGSVPVARAGMASGTADLQRDLGGAFMQSIFGALLTAGMRPPSGPRSRAAPDAAQVTSSVQAAAHEVFLERRGRRRPVPAVRDRDHGRGQDLVPGGRRLRLLAGIIAVLVGAAIVFLLFPRKADEERLLAEYHAEDTRLDGVAA